MQPSDFLKHPYDSVMHKMESEIVARNIMVILARTGNTFRTLSWEEYEQERMKDGSFTGLEKAEFDRVIKHCVSAEAAVAFSPAWKVIPA